MFIHKHIKVRNSNGYSLLSKVQLLINLQFVVIGGHWLVANGYSAWSGLLIMCILIIIIPYLHYLQCRIAQSVDIAKENQVVLLNHSILFSKRMNYYCLIHNILLKIKYLFNLSVLEINIIWLLYFFNRFYKFKKVNLAFMNYGYKFIPYHSR